MVGFNQSFIHADLQKVQSDLSSTSRSNLPNPIQPSTLYMAASLPTHLPSLNAIAPKNIASHLNMKRLLPLTENNFDVGNLRKQNYIPLHLNPSVEDDAYYLDSSSVSSSSSTTSQKQYNCSFCLKKFMRPSSLKIHVYSHTGEKPFNCSYPGCRRKFSVRSNMRRHLRVHSN